MEIITTVAMSLQRLLVEWAETSSEASGVIQRKRKFSAGSLAQTFVFGFLAKPKASDEDLAQLAGLCGVDVTPQGVRQRFTWPLVTFLEDLFQKAIRCVVGAEEALAPLLERFTSVEILDSTTITLPETLEDRFPGCGGSHGGGRAAMKLQVQWDLRSGSFSALSVEPGRDCDLKTPLQRSRLRPGALRITDLGYFDTAVFERLWGEGVFWLSRLLFGTRVFTSEGESLSLLAWLGGQTGRFVDRPLLLGSKRRVACRLIAWRVPPEVANRRRQKLITTTRRKEGRTPSRERLAWCDWSLLVTNVPTEKLAPPEAVALYRARWQIELVFKRWKSLGLVAELTGTTAVEQLVRLWSRLLAVVVQHWLLLASVWQDGRHSLTKASEAIRHYAPWIALALPDPTKMIEVIQSLRQVLQVTTRQPKRKRATTFQLLYDVTQLEYSLT